MRVMTNCKSLFFMFLLMVSTVVFAGNTNQELPTFEHPYLFFSKNDLPEIRNRLTKEPFLTRWKIFEQNANKVLQTSPHYYKPESSDVGNSRKYLENAGKTAFAYIVTNEEKYAKRAIEEAMAMVKGTIPSENGEPGWYNPAHRDWNKGADLNTAEICYGLAMVYDWCYDALTVKERTKIKDALLEKGIQQYLNSIERENPDFWVGNPVSNWAGVVNGGVGLAALAIYNESEMARKVVEYTRKYIPEFLDHVFLKDGGGHEGIMYARYGELFALYFMMAEQRMFGLDVELMEDFNRKLAGYWDVYLHAPDLRYANFNNIGEHTFRGLWGNNHRGAGGPNSDINALMETLAPTEDPLLLWAADNGAPRFYWNGASPWYFLWRRADARPMAPDDKPELQDAVLFRGAGHAILQSDKLWLAYNAGWTSNRSHNNRDLGSFILVIDKERMVNDPGYGDGHALHHSTVIINNEDQLKAKACEYLSFGSGESFHYLASDLTNTYQQDHLDKFIRHILMVKNTYIVLLDEIKTKNNPDVEWRLQTRNKANVYDQQHALIQGEQHKLFVINAANKTETKIVPWEEKNGKLNAISKKPLKPTEEHLLVTVLFPSNNEINQNQYPSATFKDGVLTVKDSKGTNDIIMFSKNNDRWVLQQVNEEKNFIIPDGSQRSLIPFREANTHKTNLDELPPWFLPIKN